MRRVQIAEPPVVAWKEPAMLTNSHITTILPVVQMDRARQF
jgi:hypothetical protein